MRNISKAALAAMMVAALALPIAGCGSSSGSDAAGGEAAEQKGPETRVNNHTDADVEFVSLDESGITLAFSVSNNCLMVLPQRFEVAGEKYSFFDAEGNINPEVHLSADGKEGVGGIDIKEGETHEVHVAIDGVTDYTHFEMWVDNTIYSEDGGKSYPIRDVSVEVVTE